MKDGEVFLEPGDDITLHDAHNGKIVWVRLDDDGVLILSIGSERYADDLQVHVEHGQYTRCDKLCDLKGV